MIKVVVHVDEPEKWPLALGNVRNLHRSLEGSEGALEIVANSVAVGALRARGAVHASEISDLVAKGIRFCVCNNALKSLSLPVEELLPGMTVVPAGVRELVDRQMEGYAYLRP